MTDQAVPCYYDDLDATREHALALLVRGVKDRRSAMHTFTVGTIGLDGMPRQRTVVNRGYEPETRTLRFHTDARSPKLDELRQHPRASVHIYDPKAKIQLRMDARATIHEADTLRQTAWDATRDFSRECYRVVPTPGDEVSAPSMVAFTSGDDPEEGAENFVVTTLQVAALEWLYLASQGHRRARFTWDETGALNQKWLVP